MSDMVLTDEQMAEIDKAVAVMRQCGLAIEAMGQAIAAALSPVFMADIKRLADTLAAEVKQEDELAAKRKLLNEGSIRNRLTRQEMRRRARG